MTKQMGILIVLALIVASSSAQASLLSAYGFENNEVRNSVTGNLGGTWNDVGYQSGNVSVGTDTTAGCIFGEGDVYTGNPDRTFGVDFWVRPTTKMVTDGGQLFQLGGTYGVEMGIGTDARLAFRLGPWTYNKAGGALTADNWYHVALTYNANGTTRVWLNGGAVLDMWPSDGWYRDSMGAGIQIGYGFPAYDGVNNESAWGSQFDDFRVYSNTLTDAQVIADMNTPVVAVPEPGSLAAMAMGLLGLAGGVIRRRR